MKLISPIANIEIDKSFNVNNLHFAKSVGQILKDIQSDSFIQQFGTHMSEFLASSHVFYAENVEVQKRDGKISPSSHNEITDIIHGIIFFIWFVKDNAISYPETLFFEEKGHDYMKLQSSRMYSDATGCFHSVTLNEQEMKETLEWFRLSSALTKRNVDHSQYDIDARDSMISASLINYIPYNQNNRIDRALLFLQFARGSSILPQKISFYMLIFECLFTTDNTEVSHKVAERPALYLGGSSEEMFENYKFLKNAYSLRSKFIHGQVLDKKHGGREEQIKISKRIDELIRIILKRIIKEDSALFLGDQLDNFLNSLIFKRDK